MSLIDRNGNVNDGLLQKELAESLAADLKYKQVDNMKKRAVKVAADYDQFKAMVACAHLKKISSEEVASLSAVKKGWTKNHTADQSSGAQLLTEERYKKLCSTETNRNQKLRVSKANGPKTCMELERDLRRLSSDGERLTYLLESIHLPIIDVLKRAADTDVLEQILQVLSAAYTVHPASSDPPSDCAQATEEQVTFSAATNIVEWLSVLGGCGQFGLMVRFASGDLVAATQRFLERALARESAMGADRERVNHLQALVAQYAGHGK